MIGGYSVVLPDGRIQHVKYTADHYSGFIAEVNTFKVYDTMESLYFILHSFQIHESVGEEW